MPLAVFGLDLEPFEFVCHMNRLGHRLRRFQPASEARRLA
jgi:hypothetical protein